MGTVFAVTRNASKSPIESEVLKSKRDKRRMYSRQHNELAGITRDAIFPPLDTEIYEE